MALVVLLWGLIALIVSIFGSIGYIIHYFIGSLANKEAVTSPIEIAGIAATLGGLVLVGAFYKERKQGANEVDLAHTKDLKCIGKQILFSASCFIIAFFALEYLRLLPPSEPLSFVENLYVYATDFAILFGGISLSIAVSFLIVVVWSL